MFGSDYAIPRFAIDRQGFGGVNGEPSLMSNSSARHTGESAVQSCPARTLDPEGPLSIGLPRSQPTSTRRIHLRKIVHRELCTAAYSKHKATQRRSGPASYMPSHL